MKEFDKDVLHWKNYDLVVINDDFEKCYNKIIKFIDLKIKNISENYDKKKIEKHVSDLLE